LLACSSVALMSARTVFELMRLAGPPAPNPKPPPCRWAAASPTMPTASTAAVAYRMYFRMT
jgi:hypothetical protein